MAEHCNVYGNGKDGKDAFIRKLYAKLSAEGWKNLVYLPNDEMYTGDYEGTVDGCHPNDIGMESMSKAFGNAVRTLSDIRRARVFLKYGGPDALAMRISEGVPQMQIGSTFVTDTYIMQTGNFETFVAFEEILLLYRHEHSTNGVKDGIALMVHDAFGDKFKYPFKLGKRHADEMQDAVQIIMQRAERAAMGYTPENLAYANMNARKPADE